MVWMGNNFVDFCNIYFFNFLIFMLVFNILLVDFILENNYDWLYDKVNFSFIIKFVKCVL